MVAKKKNTKTTNKKSTKKKTQDRTKAYSSKFKSTEKSFKEILEMAKEDIKKHPVEAAGIALSIGYLLGRFKK